MVERDVVMAKATTVDRCLRRIADARRPGRNLEPQDQQDIVELNLQRAVQATIDLAAHVVSTEGYDRPGKLADTYFVLEREGVIPRDLAERLSRMVGFRNIVVHDYGKVDPGILESIVRKHLEDLRRFTARVLERFEIEADGP